MNLLLNLLPAVCFFVAYKLSGSLIGATAALLASSAVCMGLSWLLRGSVSRSQTAVLVLLLIFAVPTVVIKDPSFIKWKVSVVNAVIAAALLLCQFVFKKNVVEALSGYRTPIPESLFRKATAAAAVFFLLCAGLNYVLAFRLPDLAGVDPREAEDIWVNYKAYGNGILNSVFITAVFFWIYAKLDDGQREELEKLLGEAKRQKSGSAK